MPSSGISTERSPVKRKPAWTFWYILTFIISVSHILIVMKLLYLQKYMLKKKTCCWSSQNYICIHFLLMIQAFQVCHGNVIRYCVCRALQLDPQVLPLVLVPLSNFTLHFCRTLPLVEPCVQCRSFVLPTLCPLFLCMANLL